VFVIITARFARVVCAFGALSVVCPAALSVVGARLSVLRLSGWDLGAASPCAIADIITAR
jgi:hypothetical protein